MEREHMRVHEENKTEAGKVQWVRLDRLDDVGGPVGQRWGRPDEDGDSRTKMGTNPDTSYTDKFLDYSRTRHRGRMASQTWC